MKLRDKQTKVNLIFCLILLAIVSLVFWVEYDRPWKAFQRQFNKMDAELTRQELSGLSSLPAGEEKEKKQAMLERLKEDIDARRPKIKQLWLTELGNTDRCTTCHLGVEEKRFADTPQPYTTHPGKHLDPDRHSLEKFGCVICHDGQGVALETDNAHGDEENWLHPLLAGHNAESSCANCHPMKTEIPAASQMEDAPVFSHGRSLYLENNCLGCHTLEGFARSERIGPILTKIGTKSTTDWVQYWIEEPKRYLPKTAMPSFQLPKKEIKAITAYLISLQAPLPKDITLRNMLSDSEATQQGKQVVDNLGCLGCHTIQGKGQFFGPDLSRIGIKASPEWIFAWVKDPKQYWPKTAMPKLRVSDDEARHLVAYLSSLQDPQSNIPKSPIDSNPELIETGRLLVEDKGCTGCHEVASFPLGFNALSHFSKSVEPLGTASITTLPLGFNAPEHNGVGSKRVDELVFGNTDIPHTLLDYLKTKVTDPRAFSTKDIVSLMPNFGLKNNDVEALSTFLLSLSEKPVLAKYIRLLDDPATVKNQGELLIEEFNCRGCHTINKIGGTIGPDLSFEGNRANPEWLANFLQTPYKIRPEGTLPTRMPTFGMSAEQVQIMALYFANQNKVAYPYYLADSPKQKTGERDKAWQLYWNRFACHSCHSWNDRGGVVGPEQSNLSGRLRREWITDWLKNPQKIIPDVTMPNFELFDGELELLTNLLMSFNEVPAHVWDEMKRRWEDEELARQMKESGDEQK